jgi:hypothetical protein
MSISTTTRKAGPFTGNGVTVSFPFAFKVFAVDDVKVVRGEIATAAELELTRGVHYGVALNSNQDTNPGGTVNWIGTPLSSAFTLVIGSKVASTQPANFTNLGRFYPRVINDALDRLTILVQQLAEEVSRSVKVGFSGLISPDQLVGTITTAASTATAGAASAAASADAALDAVTDAQAAIAGAVQADGSVPMTGALTLAGNAAANLQAVPKQQLDAVAAARMQYSLTASQATASGLSVDVLSVPSWAARITVMLNGVSTNGTFNPLLQLGSGSFSTSGYSGSQSLITTGVGTGSLNNGFSIGGASAASARCGIFVFEHLGNNAWVCSGTIGFSDSAGSAICAGVIALAGTLDRLRLFAGGTDQFDGGGIRVLIEG